MAQWGDYLNLFESSERPVIEESIDLPEAELSFETYGRFRNNFELGTPSLFNDLSLGNAFLDADSSIEKFAQAENRTRAAELFSVENIWVQFINSHYNYIQDLNE